MWGINLGQAFGEKLGHLEPFLGFITNDMQIAFLLCSLKVLYAKLEAMNVDSCRPRGFSSPVVCTEHFSYPDELDCGLIMHL